MNTVLPILSFPNRSGICTLKWCVFWGAAGDSRCSLFTSNWTALAFIFMPRHPAMLLLQFGSLGLLKLTRLCYHYFDSCVNAGISKMGSNLLVLR